jgi:hypothetical protein
MGRRSRELYEEKFALERFIAKWIQAMLGAFSNKVIERIQIS